MKNRANCSIPHENIQKSEKNEYQKQIFCRNTSLIRKIKIEEKPAVSKDLQTHK